MAKKVVISKSGYDAKTETNPDNLIFSSDYNTLKYDQSGYKDVAYNENTSGVITYYTATVAHNFSSIPFFYAFVDIDKSGKFTPCPKLAATTAFVQSFYVFADTTNLTFVCQMQGKSGSAKTARFRYFIFKNKLDL